VVLIHLLAKTEQDEPFLYELYCNIRADEFRSWPIPEDQKSLLMQMQYDMQRQQYDQPYSYRKYDVIWHEEQRIGRFIVDRQDNGWRIVDISIMPMMQNHGFGSRLITELQQEAKLQRKEIALSVLLTNPAARLYERLGFKECRRDEVYMGMVYNPLEN